MRTYIYTRVSTYDQVLHGHSLEAQTQLCLDYCAQNNLFLGEATNTSRPGVFIDAGRSAYKHKFAKRPGGFALLGVLRPGDTIVAVTVHRMFRNTLDMVTLMEHWVDTGVNVRFTDYPMLDTHTANGKAMLSIFAVMAQMKSELISARTKEAFAMRRERAEQIDPAPVPKKHPEFRVSVKNEIAIVQMLAVERSQNKFSLTGQVRAYVRVSTKDQTVEQQKACILRSLPPGTKAEDVVWYEDVGYSAYSKNVEDRPAGGRMLNDLREGDQVVVWRPDRIFRSLLDMARVVKSMHGKGASVFITETGIRTDTTIGKTMLSMLTALAEMESEEISRSTKQGLMVAYASNPAARERVIPRFLRKPETHPVQKHYAFEDIFSMEERRDMYMLFFLTADNYRTARTACRVISNNFLHARGLPPLVGEVYDSLAGYRSRLKKHLKTNPNPTSREVLKRLASFEGGDVAYPVNLMSISYMSSRIKNWMRVSRMIEGSADDKMLRMAISNHCENPALAVELGKILSPC